MLSFHVSIIYPNVLFSWLENFICWTPFFYHVIFGRLELCFTAETLHSVYPCGSLYTLKVWPFELFWCFISAVVCSIKVPNSHIAIGISELLKLDYLLNSRRKMQRWIVVSPGSSKLYRWYTAYLTILLWLGQPNLIHSNFLSIYCSTDYWLVFHHLVVHSAILFLFAL